VLLTQVVEYINTLFTFMFLIEMLLKWFAYGIYGYIKDLYNVFDCIVVSISVYEVIENFQSNFISSNSAGVSVLRTFRLLRIIKFIRFLPTMRKQCIIILNSFHSIASFLSLLGLFIFIFRYESIIII
jgi:voltage-dependent calcium channel T type alpha-1G